MHFLGKTLLVFALHHSVFQGLICLLLQVLQWMEICLPMHGTWVQSLVQEDSTCHSATKPTGHNF